MHKALRIIFDFVTSLGQSTTLDVQEMQTDFRNFCTDTETFTIDDWQQLDRLDLDAFISIEQFFSIVRRASGYPNSVTDYDWQRFIEPFNQGLLHKIKSGLVKAYSPIKNAQNLNHYTVRLGDVLEEIFQSNFPDGGRNFCVESQHSVTELNTDRLERYLDLKAPMLYGLIFVKDQRSFLPDEFQPKI